MFDQYYYLIGVFVLIYFIWYLINAIPYKNSSYYSATHKPFLVTFSDKGAYGEYLTYKYLKQYEEKGAKFLFNCYIPKNNDETSEIDVMMIYRSGIYVFESKNYGGWIFGSESSKTWTQTLPNGRTSRKERFYNPIMQNRTHVKWLQKQVDVTDPMHCIVVFSERCEFKKLELTSGDIEVIKRYDLSRTVREIDERVGTRLDEKRINEIYEKLYPNTQVSGDVKAAHIENIEKKYKEPHDDALKKPIFFEKLSSDESDMICPRCGNKLVLRTSKKGENAGNRFYGCSSYPKCRYIKNL